MKIRAVIFDLGGVIVRTEDKSPRTRLGERFGMSYAEIDRFVFDSPSAKQATLGLCSTRDHWLSICRELKLPDEELEAVQNAFWGGDQVDVKLVDFIRSLRQQFRTALLSNAWDDLRWYLKNRWGILDVFDEVIISAEVGLAKPDMKIFHLAVERLGVAPGEAVFVDDFPENVAGARAAGLQAILFHSREQVIAKLEEVFRE
jgi:HAD superfamily hydrolase (TIGR01509 family)